MFQNYQKICEEVLEPLTEKQKEVIERRFGLGTFTKRETLEAIGKDFGVTRERIRQIQNNGLAKLQHQPPASDLKKAFSHFKDYLHTQQGLNREDILLAKFGGESFKNQIYFLLDLGASFFRYPEGEDFYPFWTSQKDIFQKVRASLTKLLKKLEKWASPVSEQDIIKEIPLSFIEISKKIESGPMGDYGLVTWPEIRPRGVKDKTFLALKKAGQPLHFTQIADIANQLFSSVLGQERKVLPQTVHNELIRDQRFVLVGRGKYALREWGYKPGTVREIIMKILKEKRKPVPREEILKETLNQREVKPNTVVLALSDKKYFEKDSQGNYTICET